MLQTLLSPYRLLLAYRAILVRTILIDLKSRYAGSVIGLVWIFLYPLIFLGTYSIVYLQVFKVRFPDFGTVEYIIYMFAGLVPFIGISESIATGCTTILFNRSLIKNTLFPVDLLGVKSTVLGHITSFVGMFLIVGALISINKFHMTALLVLPLMSLQIMFLIGLVWFISSITVFIRDLQGVIGVFNFLLMMVSPIAYREEMVPAHLVLYLKLNPFYYFITSYQKVLVLGEVPSLRHWVFMITLAFTFFCSGFYFFRKVKGVIVDNI